MQISSDTGPPQLASRLLHEMHHLNLPILAEHRHGRQTGAAKINRHR